MFTTISDAIKNTKKDPYGSIVRSVDEVMIPLFDSANEQLDSIRHRIKDAGGLIVAPDIDTAHKYKKAIELHTGYEIEIVTSSSDNDDKRELTNVNRINNFKESNKKWLISVNMVSEGVDIKRLMVCLFLGNGKTELLFRQITGRIERVRNKDNMYDLRSYMFTVKHPLLEKYIKKMEDEDAIGVVKREKEEKEGNDDGGGGGGGGPRGEYESIFGDISIDRTDNGTIIIGGKEYTDNEIEFAYEIKNRSQAHSGLPLDVILEFARAELRGETKSEHSSKPSMNKQKAIARKQINTEFKRKMGLSQLGGDSELYGEIHSAINYKIDGKRSAEYFSLEQLKQKLSLIEDTKDMTIWIRRTA